MNRYRAKYEQTAGGYTWDTDGELHISEGAQAKVRTLPGQDDLVVVYTRYQHKIDWYKFNGWLLGHSEAEGWHVAVLPMMDDGFSIPQWYDQLADLLITGVPADHYDFKIPSEIATDGRAHPRSFSMKVIEFVVKNPDGWNKNLLYWIKKFNGFFQQYPEYISTTKAFDLTDSNIMEYDGDLVIIDPFN